MSAELMLAAPLINELLIEAEKRQLVEVLGAADGKALSEIRYALSAAGRKRAAEAFEVSQYIGPAPVPLTAFQTRILRQRITNERVDRAAVEQAFGDLTITKDFIDRLGPGINSGRSMLLYGPAGNGKTSVAERIARIFRGVIYIPYCVEIEGQLVKVFDPTLHEALPQVRQQKSATILRDDFDRRWVASRRPVVITGGELTLEMLDLQYNTTARFYEAPLHVKALGGTFIIDDFGRQLVSPEQLLNRWIVPMQSRVDYLKLHTGKSFSLPFDELIIFSTNMDPSDLMDPAFLRRIPYKLEIKAPSREEYRRIFRLIATQRGVEMPDDVATLVIEELQTNNGFQLACYQPRFVVDQVIAACKYLDIPTTFSPELVLDALGNMYVSGTWGQKVTSIAA
jgi:SpoVK/Ycf46/Vps4 family AAA+-type ATPase